MNLEAIKARIAERKALGLTAEQMNARDDQARVARARAAQDELRAEILLARTMRRDLKFIASSLGLR